MKSGRDGRARMRKEPKYKFWDSINRLSFKSAAQPLKDFLFLVLIAGPEGVDELEHNFPLQPEVDIDTLEYRERYQELPEKAGDKE